MLFIQGNPFSVETPLSMGALFKLKDNNMKY